MYLFREDIVLPKFNHGQAAKEIGITGVMFSYIINRKRQTTKMTAYCITKYLDSEKEISDYFIRIK